MCYSQSILIVRILTTLTEAVNRDLSQCFQSLSFLFRTVLLPLKQSNADRKAMNATLHLM